VKKIKDEEGDGAGVGVGWLVLGGGGGKTEEGIKEISPCEPQKGRINLKKTEMARPTWGRIGSVNEEWGRQHGTETKNGLKIQKKKKAAK